MKLLNLLLAACAIPLIASQFTDSTKVYIQPISSSSSSIAPISLVEIRYNPSTLSAELVSYETPLLPSDSKLLRIGIYDTATSTWKSSTSMTSAESFAKGYRPTLVLSLDAQGAVLGVACKSSKVSAGGTRDFGPGVKVVKTVKGVQPSLNRYVFNKDMIGARRFC